MKKLVLGCLLLCAANTVYGQTASYENFAGQKVSYEDLIKGPKTVLFLWTTWCPYCRDELVYLNKNRMLFPDITFVYANIGETRAKMQKMVSRLALSEEVTQKIILDPASSLGEKFSIIGVPTFVFLKNGVFIDTTNGFDEDIVREIYGQ